MAVQVWNRGLPLSQGAEVVEGRVVEVSLEGAVAILLLEQESQEIREIHIAGSLLPFGSDLKLIKGERVSLAVSSESLFLDGRSLDERTQEEIYHTSHSLVIQSGPLAGREAHCHYRNFLSDGR